jgi:hypothetical protein
MSHTSLAQSSPASQHVHHPISGLDAVNFPARTEGGPQRTDEYTLETTEGFIRPSDELPPVREEATDRSPTSTIVHGDVGADVADLTPAEREKGLDIKLVTWRDNDPDDPKNLPQSRKWLVTIAISYMCFAVALGSSLTVMDMPEVAAEFGVSIDLIHLSIAVRGRFCPSSSRCRPSRLTGICLSPTGLCLWLRDRTSTLCTPLRGRRSPSSHRRLGASALGYRLTPLPSPQDRVEGQQVWLRN